MKYLEKYKNWEIGYSDDEVKAAEILDSLQNNTLSSNDIERCVFDYCDSLNTLITLSKNYLETEDFKLVPIDTTRRTGEDIKQLYAFREMVENSTIMKYEEESSEYTEFNLVEWNGIKMVDYSTHSDKILDDDQYFIDGITIGNDDYKKLTKIPAVVFNLEYAILAYLNDELTLDELIQLKDIA